MTTDGITTINHLVELFHKSRSKGESVNLSMESRDGKDYLTFSIEYPAGVPAGPRTAPPPPSWTPPRGRKSPSQWKRDQKRKDKFIAMKKDSVQNKKEGLTSESKSTFEQPNDEIDLVEIPTKKKIEAPVESMFKIVGEYKDPKFRPWSTLDPEKEVKFLWEKIKSDNELKGIHEIGEGSTCFEHCYEFWGTWQIMKPGISIDFLKNEANWPSGIKILEVEPA